MQLGSQSGNLERLTFILAGVAVEECGPVNGWLVCLPSVLRSAGLQSKTERLTLQVAMRHEMIKERRGE